MREIANTGAAADRTTASGLPENFALFCPQCATVPLSDATWQCTTCGFELGRAGRIAVVAYDPSEDDYAAEGAGSQERVRERHFWFPMRNRFIRLLLERLESPSGQRRFVEFGCSNGLVMAELESAGWNVLGVDMHLSGLRNAAETVTGPLVCAPLDRVRLERPADAVGLFDVVEHVADDRGALAAAISQLGDRGYLVLTVPAFQGLWSSFDVLLGHKRRYTREQIVEILSGLGLEVLVARYAFSLIFPFVWLQRKVAGRTRARNQRDTYYRPPNFVINAFLTGLCRFEILLARCGIDLPFGTSVMAVARKKPTVAT